MKKKTLKRGRKSKEDKLIEELENLHKRFQELDLVATKQNNNLRLRVEERQVEIRKLDATINSLHTVISVLGHRIEDLEDINQVRKQNYQNLQAESVYSEAEKRM